MSSDSVCAIARRHGLLPQQVFGWRRQLRAAADAGVAGLEFVPAVIDAGAQAPASGRRRSAGSQTDFDAGTIKLDVDGVTIRAGCGADVPLIATLVRALKGEL
jgi:transposase